MSAAERTTAGRRPRRLDGWGFEGETFAPSAEMVAWLGARLALPAS